MKNLKFLFEAEFFDNKPKYKQNQQDASITELPKKDENGILQGRSAFYDLRDDVAKGNIKRFSLVETYLSLLPRRFTVDLADGHFEINGIPFQAMSDRPLPAMPEKFTLIYFRFVQQDQIVKYQLKTGQILSTKPGERRVEYMIGWQCTISGKNYQQTIVIS